MIVALMLACASDGGDSAGPPSNVCGDGDAVTIESGYLSQGNTFAWEIDPAFSKAGGVLVTEDTPTLEATCPPCVAKGTTDWEIRVSVTNKADEQTWAYVVLEQRCP